MNRPDPEATAALYEPARPTLVAAGIFAFWVALLALPMLSGKWLAGPWSDQYSTGYAFRAWGAEWWRRTGHVPLWNPELFGGLPFVAAQHGDIFYPTSFLRLVLPTVTVMNLGFVIHYMLAGLFTYLLLRLLRFSWTGAVMGGLAYELSGLIASYPQPGHDGKLFVGTLLPLALIGLVLALRDWRWAGYPLLALAVGLALLSPHYQMTYYLLIAAGVFALYLSFGEPGAAIGWDGLQRLGLALAAVLVGFGLAMIQVLPFYHYLPYSPRAEGYYGFAGSTSFAIPWEHVPEFFLKNFVGSRDTYWGSNALKLHSEYLGLPVVALAVLGVAGSRRRLALWLGGLGALFLLISLGADTPFYRVWWAVMPYVKQTRAPGMAFFVVAFVAAIFAGAGAERLERKEGGNHTTAWLVAAGVVVLLAVTGVFGQIAQSFAASHEAGLGRPLAAAARAAEPAIVWGAVSSAAALAFAAALSLAAVHGRVTPPVFSLTLTLILGGDLWLNARHFWTYSTVDQELYRADPITDRIGAAPPPYRILDLGVYPGSALMAFDIPQLLGHHGNELRYYDELLGGKNEWKNLPRLKLWDLLAVRYAIAPQQSHNLDSIPGFKKIFSGTPTSAGVPANLFERTSPAPYARVVPAAVKGDFDQIIPTLIDPRLDYDRLVLFTPDTPTNPPPVTEMPEPSPARATVIAWQPGRMTVRLDPAPPALSYVLVAENWYPDWQATVDGAPAQVLRGDYTLLTVPVSAGARTVELTFRSADYEKGRALSLAALGVLILATVAPAVAGRLRRG